MVSVFFVVVVILDLYCGQLIRHGRDIPSLFSKVNWNRCKEEDQSNFS